MHFFSGLIGSVCCICLWKVACAFNLSAAVASAQDIKLAYYPGDVLLGGLLPLHKQYNEATKQCSDLFESDGIIPLEAAFFILDEINRAKILSFTLGFVGFDTCDSHSFALEQALQFIHSHSHHGKHEHEQGQAHPGDVFNVDKVVGIITGLPSSVTISLAQLLRLFQMPQISFMSTSPLLSDRRRYDYFFRTVPSDVNQVRAIVEILKFYEWNHVSIVYSDDEYGNRGLHELEKLAPNASLCLAAKLKMPVVVDAMYMAYGLFDAPYVQIVNKLILSETKIVVLFTDYKSAEGLFDAVMKKNITDIVWIGSDAWGGREDVLNDHSAEVIEGAITVQLNTRELRNFSNHYTHLAPSKMVCDRNPFFCELWQECQTDQLLNRSDATMCSDRNDMLKQQENNVFNSQVFHIDNLRDSVYAFAYALKDIHKMKCGSTSGLCEAMHSINRTELKQFLSNVSFTESDGSSFRFLDSSDGQPRYTIMNMQRFFDGSHYGRKKYRWVEIGKYTQDADLKSTLIFNNISTARFKLYGPDFVRQEKCRFCDSAVNEVRTGAMESCCGICQECKPWQFPENQKCGYCPNGSVVDMQYLRKHRSLTSFSQNICVPVVADFLDYNSAFAIPVLAVSAAGILASFFSGAVLLSYNKTPIIKAAGREHLGLLFIGLISSYGINFVILWQPSVWSCFIVRFIGVCYAVCNSTLLIKISRIYRIFNTKECRRMQKLKYISPKSQVALTLAFVFVELVIISIWSCFNLPHVLEVYPDRMQRELVCSDLHDFKLMAGLCYPLMLLFPMAYFAFRTRTCPAAFAEARHTGYGIYLTFINVLTFVLIYIGNNSIRIRVLTVCIGLCLNASVILVTSFFTKVHIVLFRPHKNSKDRIMNSAKSLGGRASISTVMVGNGSGIKCETCKSLLPNGAPVSLSRPKSNPELRAVPSIDDFDDDFRAPLNGLERYSINNGAPRRNSTLLKESHSVV